MATRFAPLTPEDPRQVGGYPLRARLGVGGMGRVYLSFTPGGRALAIKVLRPEHAEDEEFRRRFQHEVTAAQRVQGLYTAPVVDADATAPLPWLATAYVPGPSLRQAVAEGLAAVHACGIVHRDLTPANVLLAEDGPRVIDFGIAHAAAATSLTRTGMRIGTPAYMAPEQIRGQSATPATDIFALGHLAVFAATGGVAFGEGNQEALLYRIINEPPDLDHCPHELRTIAIRCLAKQPPERPSLTEVIEYAREQTRGQTMHLAGSWLPATIAAALSSYDTAAYLPGETKRSTKIMGANPGQPTYRGNGQPYPGYGQQHPGYGPPPGYLGTPPIRRRKVPTPLIVFIAIAYAVVVGLSLAATMAMIGSGGRSLFGLTLPGGGFGPTALDPVALENGVQQVLTNDYQINGVGAVSCPANEKATQGTTFTCTVLVGGAPKNVTITVLDSTGRYQVGQPQG